MKLSEKFSRNLMNGNFNKNILELLITPALKFIKKIDLVVQSFARRHFVKNIPVQKNKILFINSQGAYTCNHAPIANEILKQNLPYELIFTYNKQNKDKPSIMNEFPSNVKIVERGSYNFFKEAASAKILIDNSISLEVLNVPKKREQVWIQTWHGSLGLKRLSKEHVQDKKWVKKAIAAGKKTDYCISNSTFETNTVYKPNYWNNCEILEYGHPRNDIFFNENTIKAATEKVKNFFNIDSKKKILLYAPTFRDDSELKYYNIDFEKLKVALHKKFGGEWVILLRLHYKINKLSKNLKDIDGIINATHYCNMQELIAACDVGITDYSSWICDLVLTNKPGFLYAIDLESYEQERGWVYPLSETPFPLATNNDSLVDNILNFNHDLYEKKRLQFLKLRGCIECGNASKRVVEKIKEIIDSVN